MRYIQTFITLLSGAILTACQSFPDVAYHQICPDTNCNISNINLKEAVKERQLFVENHGWQTSNLDEGTEANKHKKSADRTGMPWIKVNYHHAWLEYSVKHRKLFDVVQKKAILQYLSEPQNNNQPVYAVIYVHGWHHNADTSNKSPSNHAIAFDDLMGRNIDAVHRKFEIQDKFKNHPIPTVLGIYIGWQGESIRKPSILSLLTVKSRADAADRIGLGTNLEKNEGLRNDLMEIAEAVRRTSSQSRLILIGHSFGGRMLTSAFLPEFTETQGVRRLSQEPLGSRVLIVTLNSAVGADCFDDIFLQLAISN